ncbi:hypothetical protein [Frigoribacterium sp. Leaf44]|uniref:hypothetical protein n=1 Tax=Frigoribacterium sp. Leaf44 TaxID=1736220 RepID=UPI000A8550D1|nr:hypothetical protein [Frigoribacterium sp. Leaf44]
MTGTRGVARAARQMRRLALHVLVPAVGAAAPLAVVPAVTSTAGAAGWAAIAVGLSVGVAAAVVAELGWGIVGPQRVVRQPAARSRLYAAALASRLVAVALTTPLAAVVTGLVVVEHRPAAVLVAVGVSLGALSPAWFFIGLGRPVVVLLAETSPRVVTSLASAVAIVHGAPLEVYGSGLIVSVVAALALASLLDDAARPPRRRDFAGVPATVREQRVLVLGRAVTTTYKSLPSAMLGGVAPGAVAGFAAVDRPLRMGLQVVSAVPDRLQTWVGHPSPGLARRRSLWSLFANAMLGLVVGVAFATLMPSVGRLLFTGAVDVPPTLAVWGGVLAGVVCASRGAGLALVSAGRPGCTTLAASCSAAVGVPGLLVLGERAGAAGALAALAAAETVGLVVQLVAVAHRPGGHGPGSHGPGSHGHGRGSHGRPDDLVPPT